jgi:hypothetical protein
MHQANYIGSLISLTLARRRMQLDTTVAHSIVRSTRRRLLVLRPLLFWLSWRLFQQSV